MPAFALAPSLPFRSPSPRLRRHPLAQLRPNPPSTSTPRTSSATPPPPPPPPPSSPPPPPSPPPPGTARDTNYAPDHIAVSLSPSVPDSSLPLGTVYFAVPSRPPHLPPLAHYRDGDGFILAVSFGPDGQVWARSRFVRTKPFMREAREKRRVYRGRYGTAGSKGLTAPIKPKPTCADGIMEWGKGKRRRVVAFGDAGLPLALDMATLVSRKPTALGSCLTDAPELAGLRGSELSAPPVVVGSSPVGEGGFSEGEGPTLALCARTRSTNGRVSGIVINEIDEDLKPVFASNRLPLAASSHVAAFAVTESYYIVFYNKVQAGPANPLSSLFGGDGSGGNSGEKSDASPKLDNEFGTRVMFVSRGGNAGGARVVTAELPSIFVTSCVGAYCSDSGNKVSLHVSAVAPVPGMTIGFLANANVGRPDGSNANMTGVHPSSLLRYEIDLSGSGMAKVADAPGPIVSASTNVADTVSFHGPAPAVSLPARHGWQRDGGILSAFVSNGNCGIALLDSKQDVSDLWTAGNIKSGLSVSTPVVAADGRHALALLTGEEEDARVVVLDIKNIAIGPVCEVLLPDTKLSPCVSGLWSERVFTWEEHGRKPAKSAYELFEDKEWNNINSSFSSFGFNQD